MFASIARPTLYLFPALITPALPRRRSPAVLNVGFSVFGLLLLLLTTAASAAQVTLAWDGPRDPNLSGYIVYYRDASGSYEGAVDVGRQTTYTLTDLEEGQVYYFTVTSYDANGGESKRSSEIIFDGPTGDSKGDADENALTDRDETDQTESDSEAIQEEADETDTDEQDTMPVLEPETETDQDTDRSEARTDLHVIPQSQLSIVSVDSEPLRGDGAAESAIDGRVETFWRTEMGPKAPVHPHALVIALGEEYMVKGFRYLPRQDGKTEGMVARYSFYVSEDGVDWGKAVITGTFSRGAVEHEVTFTGKMGSFVRFVAHSELNGKPWTSVAELTVLAVRR
jgi:hypothetical protein